MHIDQMEQNREHRNRPTQIQSAELWHKSKGNSMEKKIVFSKTCAGSIRHPYAKEKEHRDRSSAIYKNYLDYIKVLNMKGKNIKHLD